VNFSRGGMRLRVAAAVVAALTLALAGCTRTSPPGVLAVTDPGDGRSGAIGGDAGNGGVKLRNFLVVSEGNGKPGTLVGAISNETNGPVQVTLTVVQTDQSGQQSPIGSTSVSLKPSEFVQFGNPAGGSGGTASPTGAAATPTSTPSTAESIGSKTPYTPTPDTVSNSSALGPQPATGRVVDYRIPTVSPPAGSVLQLFARSAEGGVTIDLPVLPPVGSYAELAPQATSSSASSPSPTGSAGSTSSPSVNPSGAATQTPTAEPSPTSG